MRQRDEVEAFEQFLDRFRAHVHFKADRRTVARSSLELLLVLDVAFLEPGDVRYRPDQMTT